MTKKFKTLMLVFMSMMLLAVGQSAHVMAQNCTPIAYGQSVNNTISNQVSEVYYCFNGQAGDVITVEMVATSGNLDSYLDLGFNTESPEISNDDNSGTLNSRIDYTLPQTTQYVITASRFGFSQGTTTGDFTLTLNSANGNSNSNPNVNSNMTQIDGVACEGIDYGTSLSGTITAGETVVYYCFNGTAGDVVTIEMIATSGDLDSYLDVGRSTESPDATNDDNPSGGTLNSLIEYTLTETTLYVISASHFGFAEGTTTGDFTLTLNGSTDNSNTNTNTNTGQTTGTNCQNIAYGQSLSETITNDRPEINFCFNGQAGDVITVDMNATSGDLDSVVAVGYDTERPILENDDASDTTRDARVELTLPETREYVITALRYQYSDGTTTGDFTLTLNRASGSSDNGTATNGNTQACDAGMNMGADVTEIRMDQSHTRYIEGGWMNDIFCFAANEGDVVYITMYATSGNLDSHLTLWGTTNGSEDSVILSSNDNEYTPGSFTTNAAITYMITETGLYDIVPAAMGETAGDYTIGLYWGQAPTDVPCTYISHDYSFNGTVTSDSADTYCLNGQAGDRVRIEMTKTSGDLEPYLRLVEQERIDRDFSSYYAPALADDRSEQPYIEYTLPDTGLYVIQAGRPEGSLSSGGYHLSMLVTPDTSDNNVIDNSSCTQIDINNIFTLNIDNNTPAWGFCFNGRAGETVAISMTATSGNLDSYLYLYDGLDGALIAENDDIDGTLNSSITVTLTETRLYFVRATRFGDIEGASSGDFEFSIENR